MYLEFKGGGIEAGGEHMKLCARRVMRFKIIAKEFDVERLD